MLSYKIKNGGSRVVSSCTGFREELLIPQIHALSSKIEPLKDTIPLHRPKTDHWLFKAPQISLFRLHGRICTHTGLHRAVVPLPCWIGVNMRCANSKVNFVLSLFRKRSVSKECGTNCEDDTVRMAETITRMKCALLARLRSQKDRYHRSLLDEKRLNI